MQRRGRLRCRRARLALALLVATAAGLEPTLAQERWSAVAVSSEAYGWSRDIPKKDEAERQALVACNSISRKEACEARTFTAPSCGAIVGWNYIEKGFRQFGHSAAIGVSLKAARDQALADCRARYRGCRLSTSFCSR